MRKIAFGEKFTNQVSAVWRRLTDGINSYPGMYHFIIQDNGQRTRVHLRVESDLSGVLLVDADRIFHLNPSGCLMALLLLRKTPRKSALHTLSKVFQITNEQASFDFDQFEQTWQNLISKEGVCPVCDLELDTIPPFSANLSAPYRMDLALTYRCNNCCSHCYNETRSSKELSINEWKNILDRLWETGIPHIVFTGGEPTLFPQLPELIAHAEKNGQITGLNTNGRLLKNSTFVQELVDAGLDHVQITVESHLPDIHDQMVKMPGAWKDTIAGIRNVVDSPLYMMTNTTMLEINSPFLEQTLDFLNELSVPTVGLNALIYSGKGTQVGSGLREDQLAPLLDLARKKTTQNQQRLIWYTPTQYCHFDPVQTQLGVKGCTAALYNMCIEPDGNVIPCQSYYSSLGNIQKIEWEKIWNHPLAIQLRKRQNVPSECRQCSLLTECGGGCPLAIQAGKLSQPICIPSPLNT